MKKVAICPQCKTKVHVIGELKQKKSIKCKKCGKTGIIVFRKSRSLSHIPQKTIMQQPPPKTTKSTSARLRFGYKRKKLTKDLKTKPSKNSKTIAKNQLESKTHHRIKKPKKTTLKSKQKQKKHLINQKEKHEKETTIKEIHNQPTPQDILQNEQKETCTDITTTLLKKEEITKQPTTSPIEIKQDIKTQSTDEKILKKSTSSMKLEELDFYPVNEPFAYIKILKDTITLNKYYKVIEPQLKQQDQEYLHFIKDILIKNINILLEEIEADTLDSYLIVEVDKILDSYNIEINDITKRKFLYYIKRDYIGYGKIDALMHDPNIEDISCDGSNGPVFLYHRIYSSLKSNVIYFDENELSAYVIRLAQKCGKHISIAEPMLDATMPDGSRIQMTLSKAVTAKGSTFTIRKFRSDPITPTDLINYNTMSAEMVAYMWMAVENGINALISGGTASGKTSALNALALFIPRESKIVSIEETREINLPHPNWIPGVSRSGLGEVVNDKMVGEIGLFELMKAALRQRPEYILVGEIRGEEAYVLFQAMATGHTTYSTVHADSPKALIHRLEGKPINIPRMMLQSLDIVVIQASVHLNGKNVRRCRQIVEIIDIDSLSKEILTNEVFHWDPVVDKHIYSGKSYILERIRSQYDMSTDGLSKEFRRRVRILEWMKKTNIRVFKDFAAIISIYSENPEKIMQQIDSNDQTYKMNFSNGSTDKILINQSKTNQVMKEKNKKQVWKR
jgi:flagellar protein FlaI